MSSKQKKQGKSKNGRRNSSANVNINTTSTTTNGQTSENNDLADNYVRTKVVLMVLCGFIAMSVLIVHIEDLNKIENYKKKLTDVRMPVFLLLNISTLFGGGIGFGRPFVALFVSFIGLVAMAIEVKTFPGLIEWTEKLTVILSSLGVVGEYLFIGIRHWLKTSNITEIRFLFYTLLVIGAIFSYGLHLHFRSS